VRWERFFEDLEQQLDSEWEAERAALDTEAERLRLARLALRTRLHALAADDAEVALDVGDGDLLRGRLTGVGADWVTLDLETPARDAAVVPIAAVSSIDAAHADLLRSARGTASVSLSAERMTFGFVLRDLVRRRVAVRVHTRSGRRYDGTIDRAGADHLDLALHEQTEPRRRAAVRGFRLVPFDAVTWVRIGGGVP